MTAITNTSEINARQYAASPKSIETEAESERALEIVNQLMTKGEKKLTAEEHVLLRMLVLLIEEFEKKAYPIPPAEPHEVLKTLLENRGLQQVDLLPIFGARSNVSAVLAGSDRWGRNRQKHWRSSSRFQSSFSSKPVEFDSGCNTEASVVVAADIIPIYGEFQMSGTPQQIVMRCSI